MKKGWKKWNPIPGYEGYYEITRKGIVRSVDRKVNGPQGEYVRKGQLIKQYTTRGYRGVPLNKENKNKKYLLHRLIAITFIPNIHKKPYINHRNSIKHDNRIKNLEWCTHKENICHAQKKGHYKKKTGVLIS